MENSPLNRLPAELRNRISELAYHREDAIEIIATHGTEDVSEVKFKRSIRGEMTPFAMALACKQLHAETMPLFYNTNSFILHSPDHKVVSAARCFFKMIGKQSAKAVRDLTVVRDVGILDQDPTTEESASGVRPLEHSLHEILHHIKKSKPRKKLASTATVHVKIRFLGTAQLRRPFVLRLDCKQLHKSCVNEAIHLRHHFQKKSAEGLTAIETMRDMVDKMLVNFFTAMLGLWLFQQAGEQGQAKLRELESKLGKEENLDD